MMGQRSTSSFGRDATRATSRTEDRMASNAGFRAACCATRPAYFVASAMTSTQRSTLAATDCEVAFDDLTRQLYATDASLYQLEPEAVAFPRSAQQASAIITGAADAALAVTPRGAGSGLSGGAIGDGLIVDFSRHNRQITD